MTNELANRLGLGLLGHSKFSRLSSLFAFRSGQRDEFQVSQALADTIALLAACLSGGLSLSDSMIWVSKRASGFIATEFSSITHAMQNGESTSKALLEFESEQQNQHLKELAIKLALSEQLGAPVVAQLHSFCRALRSAQLSARRELAAKKESRIMLPLVFLVLPVTVLFAVFPSIQFLSFQSI